MFLYMSVKTYLLYLDIFDKCPKCQEIFHVSTVTETKSLNEIINCYNLNKT